MSTRNPRQPPTLSLDVEKIFRTLDQVQTLTDPQERACLYKELGYRYCALHMYGRSMFMFEQSLTANDSTDVRDKLAELHVHLFGEAGFGEARGLVTSRNSACGIERWIEKKQAAITRHTRKTELERKHPPLQEVVGESQHILDVCEQIIKYAPTKLPVLITGPTGSGKELVARALHACCPRSKRPFVSVNCAAFQDTLFESQLFGHVRGAFTGADRDRRGHVEEGHGGTLLLDEISRLSLSVQPKLLRFLDSGEFYRVGDPEERHVDVRIVAATNQDLRELARDERFREDLRSRVTGVEIRLLPLEDRLEDLPLLARHFIEKHGLAREEAPFSEYDIFHWLELKYLLRQHLNKSSQWSIREFDQAVQRAVADGELQQLGDYPFEDVLKAKVQTDRKESVGPKYYTPAQLDAYDLQIAVRLCAKAKGKDAARLLGISESVLSRRKARLVGQRRCGTS